MRNALEDALKRRGVRAIFLDIEPSPTAELQVFETTGEKTQPVASEASAMQKKSARRVGQRKPQRDKIGD